MKYQNVLLVALATSVANSQVPAVEETAVNQVNDVLPDVKEAPNVPPQSMKNDTTADIEEDVNNVPAIDFENDDNYDIEIEDPNEEVNFELEEEVPTDTTTDYPTEEATETDNPYEEVYDRIAKIIFPTKPLDTNRCIIM